MFWFINKHFIFEIKSNFNFLNVSNKWRCHKIDDCFNPYRIFCNSNKIFVLNQLYDGLQLIDSSMRLLAKTFIASYCFVCRLNAVIKIMRNRKIRAINVIAYVFWLIRCISSRTINLILNFIKYFFSSNLYLKIHMIEIAIEINCITFACKIFSQMYLSLNVFISMIMTVLKLNDKKCFNIWL